MYCNKISECGSPSQNVLLCIFAFLLVMMWLDSMLMSGDELRCVTGNVLVALDYSEHKTRIIQQSILSSR